MKDFFDRKDKEMPKITDEHERFKKKIPAGLKGACDKCGTKVITKGTEKNDGMEGRWKKYYNFTYTTEGFEVPCLRCSHWYWIVWIHVSEIFV